MDSTGAYLSQEEYYNAGSSPGMQVVAGCFGCRPTAVDDSPSFRDFLIAHQSNVVRGTSVAALTHGLCNSKAATRNAG